MSSLVFVSPMAVSAMISLWFGFRMRFIMFGAWLSLCAALVLLIMRNLFGAEAVSGRGLTLLAILIVFEISAFTMGLLFARARLQRNEK
jgi:hypothetical protein